MPWEILEMEWNEDLTERDLKRAYAKKLKVTRPDRDPEGFQKLREAYEEAQVLLRIRQFELEAERENEASHVEEYDSAGIEANLASNHEPSTDAKKEFEAKLEIDTSSSSELSSPLHEEPSEEVDDFLLTEVEKNPLRFIELAGQFSEIELQLKANPSANVDLQIGHTEHFLDVHPGAIDEWGKHVIRLFESYPALNYVPPNLILIAEMQNDQVDLVHFLLNKWIKAKDVSRMVGLVDAIFKNRDMIYSYRAIGVYVRLCIALSLVAYPKAEQIGEVAFDKLGPNDGYDVAVDEALAFARYCNGLPVATKQLWCDIINRRVDVEIMDDPARKGMFAAIFQRGKMPEELEYYLCSCVSEEMAEHIRNPPGLQLLTGTNIATHQTGTGGAGYQNGGYSNATTDQKPVVESKGLGVGGWIVVALVLKFVAFMFSDCSSFSSEGSNHQLPHPSSSSQDGENNKIDVEKTRELMKKQREKLNRDQPESPSSDHSDNNSLPASR